VEKNPLIAVQVHALGIVCSLSEMRMWIQASPAFTDSWHCFYAKLCFSFFNFSSSGRKKNWGCL